MKLSKRLLMICGMVADGSSVIDVGCDHALVDIYLVKYRNVQAIAADINEKSLKGARENIKNSHVGHRIEVVCTDGLDNLDIKDKVIIICGMGTQTIISILDKIPELIMKEIIIQTNHDISTLRKFMRKKGFQITDERYLVERRKTYILIKFVPGKQEHHYMDDELGPLLKKKEPNYLRWLSKTNATLLKKVPKKYVFKRMKLKYINHCIKKELRKIF